MNVLPNRNIFRTYFFSLAALLCLLVLFAPLANAQSLPLYAVDSNDATLAAVDPLTGTILSSVTMTMTGFTVNFANGLAQNPQGGQLFVILSVTGQTGRELATVNPTTGVATAVGNLGDNFAELAFTANGTLYGVTGDGAKTASTLFTINTSTGAPTLVKALGSTGTCSSEGGSNNGESIAFNPVDGLMYHMSGTGGCQILEKINLTSLVSTNIPLSGDTAGEVLGMTHWTGNFFLISDFSDLYMITNGGHVTLMTSNSEDSDLKGFAFTGTVPSCTPLAPLYGAANSSSVEAGVLYTINPTNGTPTLIGPIGFGQIGGIRFNAGGTLFGTGATQIGSGNVSLFTINPCTGLGSVIGTSQYESIDFDNPQDISFRKSDNTLFATLFGEGPDGLATINTTTGAPTLVATLTSGSQGGGLAFSATGTLFTALNPNLYTVNTTNGALTPVGTLTFPNIFVVDSSSITAMDFQPNSGTLFGAASTSVVAEEEKASTAPIRNGGPPTQPANFLVTVNTTTGAVTSVGQTETGMNSIAFSPAVALPPASITVTGGSAQSAVIEEAFELPLQATVKDSNSNPVAGVTVTFTPPATGASATFQGNANTAVTNASGVATSAIVIANSAAGGPYNVAATVTGVATPANFALTNTVGQPQQIIINSGTPQTATVTTAFALPLSVKIEDFGGNPVPGVTITFTPPSTGASGTFTGGNTAVTNSSGIATSGTFTANGTSGGPYNVFASLPEEGSPEFRAATVHPQGFATQVTFSLKNVDFSVTPTTTTQTVTPGATANYSLSFTAIVGNSVNPTTFSCMGLPALSACTFNPTSLPANSPTTPFTLAISTTAPGTTANVGPANKFVGPFRQPGLLMLLAMLVLMLTAFAIPKRQFARMRVSAVSVFGFAALLLLTSYISGCGSTGTGFPLANNNPGTPAGTYTVTIVGTAGAVQRTTTVTLVVQ
jgi:hypothetical protein